VALHAFSCLACRLLFFPVLFFGKGLVTERGFFLSFLQRGILHYFLRSVCSLTFPFPPPVCDVLANNSVFFFLLDRARLRSRALCSFECSTPLLWDPEEAPCAFFFSFPPFAVLGDLLFSFSLFRRRQRLKVGAAPLLLFFFLYLERRSVAAPVLLLRRNCFPFFFCCLFFSLFFEVGHVSSF